jgi:hypothetical protein
MEIVHSRCAGMDVSKRDAKVCVRVAGRGGRKTVETVRTWGSTTNAILALREHLINEQVSLVVMEATGDYWKPFYYLLVRPTTPHCRQCVLPDDRGRALVPAHFRHHKWRNRSPHWTSHRTALSAARPGARCSIRSAAWSSVPDVPSGP